MFELLDKITSYNLFNYMLPGAMFCILADHLTSVELIHGNLLTSIFIYYFSGLVISRLGSLILEPTLKFLRLIKHEPHKNYLKAINEDKEIAVLLETSNMYRSLASLFILFIVFLAYFQVEQYLQFLKPVRNWILTIILLFIFLLAYRKQNNFITSRIKKICNEK